MKRLKINSIQVKFMVWILPVLSILLIGLAIGIYGYVRDKQIKVIQRSSLEIAQARADELSKLLESLVHELTRIAENKDVQSMDWDTMKKKLKTIAETRKEVYNFIYMTEADGNYFTTKIDRASGNLKDRDYFTPIMNGTSKYIITNPLVSRSTGLKSFSIVVPIKNNEGNIIGMLAGSVMLKTLADVAASINIGHSGYGFIVDNNGQVVAHIDEKLILSANLFSDSDSLEYKPDAELINNMKNGRRGFGYQKNPNGLNELVLSTPIKFSPNWNLGIALLEKEIYSEVKLILYIFIVFFSITFLIIFLILWILTKNLITKPLHRLIIYSKEIAKGNLYVEISQTNDDEVGQTISALTSMIEKIRKIVYNIQTTSQSINNGSTEIKAAAEQISQGANEQAAASEEISASMEEMAASIQQNLDSSKITESNAYKATHDMQTVSESLKTTVTILNNITHDISLINEIANKTNTLALNAAVEAARAGQYGKGFAVVANEIRKLAEHSRNSAEKIDNNSIVCTNETNRLEGLFAQTIPIIQNNSELVREITAASAEQSTNANQVNDAIYQLSKVTQQNSASSEELAASASELSSLARHLNEQVAFFKLEKNDESESMIELIQQIEEFKKILTQRVGVENVDKFLISAAKSDKVTQKKVNSEQEKIKPKIDLNIDDSGFENY